MYSVVEFYERRAPPILREQYTHNAYLEILSEHWDDECEKELNQLLQTPNRISSYAML